MSFSNLPTELHLKIAEYLTSNDLLVCIRLSKYNFATFCPVLWHSVIAFDFDGLVHREDHLSQQPSPLPLSALASSHPCHHNDGEEPDSQSESTIELKSEMNQECLDFGTILPRYSQHIFQLTLFSVKSLHDLGPACTNLTTLRFGFLLDFATPETQSLHALCSPSTLQKFRNDRGTTVVTISQILQQNPWLQSVGLKLPPSDDATMVLETLKGLRFLEELDIDWTRSRWQNELEQTEDAHQEQESGQSMGMDAAGSQRRPRRSFHCPQHIYNILDGCHCLRKLRIAGNANENENEHQMLQIHPEDYRTHTLLQALDLSRGGSFFQTNLIWKAIGLSPALHTLELPQELSKSDVRALVEIIQDHCPWIESLAFSSDLPAGEGPDHGDIGDIIDAVNCLRHVVLRQATIVDRRSILELLHAHANSIESLEIKRMYDIGHQETDVPALLVHLPRLKRFVSDTPLSLHKIIEYYQQPSQQQDQPTLSSGNDNITALSSSSFSNTTNLRVLDICVARLRQEEELSIADQDAFTAWICSSFKDLETLVIRHWDPTQYEYAPHTSDVALDIPRIQGSLRQMKFLRTAQIFGQVLDVDTL
ncbi:hypothetical protein BG011_008649 [Mortierella polycephala]|uniref:F-box domain-containing protein n=1 Tax=Mortierella polycephala TaxID=41804 RepID=A0A9P6PMM9_9FUNG|nr:hypothetical protein BG011_008649 [Mortierella polycephala]